VLFQLVIASLSTGESTGQLCISDETGSMDCVMGAWPLTTSNESLATSHHCASNNCLPEVCPYAQTSLLGGIFRIDRFQLVIECFHIPNGDVQVTCTYIQFATTDLLRLCKPSSSPFALLSSQLSDAETCRRVANDGLALVRSIDCQNDSCEDMFESFEALPSSPLPLLPTVAMVHPCQCFVSQLFVVDCCENMILHSRRIDQLSLRFTVTGCFVGLPKLSSCGCLKSAQLSTLSDLPVSRPVAIRFSGNSLRWYHVLHSACVYRLILHSTDVSPFLGKFTLPPNSKRTRLERRVARRLVVLDVDLHVERISVQRQHGVMSTDEEECICSAVNEVCERLADADGFWRRRAR